MPVRCELSPRGRVKLTGWAGDDTSRRCKSVAGAAFKKKPVPHWTFPLDLPTCRALGKAFAGQIEVAPELRAWTDHEVAKVRALTDIAHLADVGTQQLAGRAPRIAEALLPYQRVAAAWGSHAGSFLLADQPGLGKTIETLAIIAESHVEGSILVAAPSVAIDSVWRREIAQWLGSTALVFTATGTREQRQQTLQVALSAVRRKTAPYVFVVVNLEMLRLTREEDFEYPELFSVPWTAEVVDESHRGLIRSPGDGTLLRRGLMSLPPAQRIALSGTPMRGKPRHLWGTLNWLRPKEYTSFWTWADRYFSVSSDGYSDYVIGDFRDGGDTAMARDLRTVMLRRTKAEVLTDLPPKQYAGTYLIPDDEESPLGVWLKPNDKQKRQYDSFVKNAVIEFDTGEEIITNGALAEYTRKRQLAAAFCKMANGKLHPTIESPKFDWLVQKLIELGIYTPKGISERGPEEVGKIVVTSGSTRLLNAFSEGLTSLGVPNYRLTGATPTAVRVQQVENFQTRDDVRVYFLNRMAGGVAITLDAADDLVLLDESTIPDEDEQVEDRVHRASSNHSVTIHRLRTIGTIDEEVAWIAAARENVAKYVLDGTRGVDYAKSVYLDSLRVRD